MAGYRPLPPALLKSTAPIEASTSLRPPRRGRSPARGPERLLPARRRYRGRRTSAWCARIRVTA